MLTSTESAVLQAVDEALAVRTLQELIAVPSIGGAAEETEIQHLLARRLAQLDLDVDLWPLDLRALRSHPGYPGEEVSRGEAYGLVATRSPTTGSDVPALVLQAHVDVVPPGDRNVWASGPFRPTTSLTTVTGRGACDMKGGLVAILAAVAAVHHVRAEVPGGFAVHCAIGEEDGGLGAFGALDRGHRGGACVIPEPTSCAVVTANAGALTFRIEVPGLATHGSTAYVGSSAVDSYLPIHRALVDLGRRRNLAPEPLMRHLPVPYPLSVGRLSAGDWASSVPDLLVAEGRLGLRIEEEPATARAELEHAVREAAAADAYLRDHPPVVTWPGGQFRGGRLPAGHGLADLVATAHRDTTRTLAAPPVGAPWGSDLRLYGAVGIPTLHYGPGDVRLAHGPNESVPIVEVLTAARTLALLLLRLGHR